MTVHGFVMCSYIVFAKVWVHAAPKDEALTVIISAQKALSVHGLEKCIAYASERPCS